MIDDLWRKTIFFAGDIRRLSSFPYVTWAKSEHLVGYGEVLEALPLIRYGDIGLHRDIGYLSNVGIPGFMKHAWIHVRDELEPHESMFVPSQIVEAISEGVVCRSPIYPMHSDYVIILNPDINNLKGLSNKTVDQKVRSGACLKARNMVGQPYDHRFKFNIEEELKHYQTQGNIRHSLEKGSLDLLKAEKQIQNYDMAFSCTELVSYAWWHLREQLNIKRKERYGKKIILADSFLNNSWKIRWASKSVTVDVAAQMGLHDEGIEMIRKWRT